VKTILESKSEFKLNYKIDLPSQIKNGVYVLKFQLQDPFVLTKMMKKKKAIPEAECHQEACFGSELKVMILIQDSQFGEFKNSFSPTDMASIINEKSLDKASEVSQ